MRTLRFAKDGHLYIFQYGQDSEADLIDLIMQMAADPMVNLGWIDAARLTLQVAQAALSQ